MSFYFRFMRKRKIEFEVESSKKVKKNQQYVLALSVPIYAELTRNKSCSSALPEGDRTCHFLAHNRDGGLYYQIFGFLSTTL